MSLDRESFCACDPASYEAAPPLVVRLPSGMDQPAWSPSVVVGIDVGMTCTGVAHSSQDSGWARPEVIQTWPDRKGGIYSKYPTRVAYDRTGKAVDWGTCSLSERIHITAKEFKLQLDPSYQDIPEAVSAHQKAVEHYVNYMKELIKHVDGVLEERFLHWRDRQVEYRFSIPTTWYNPALTTHLMTWLAQAGLTNTPNRKVMVSRTEAEAAAVYVAQDNQLQAGDVIMVVDAGGATTDINLLQVIRKEYGNTQLKALGTAEGITVGSTMIDNEARKLIEQKLKSRQVYDPHGITRLAESMMDKSFEFYKCNFSEDGGSMDYFPSFPGRDGQFATLKHAEVKDMFDRLIVKLIRKIKEQIVSLARSPYPAELRYIVLSGGLGSSKYVKQRIMAEICTNAMRLQNGGSLTVLVAKDPQLAVVKGLVMERAQTVEQDIPVWSGRCCRVSYGILCRRIYKANKHFGEPTVKDPLTGALWVEDQIDWIIKVGDVIPETGITRRYGLRLAEDSRLEPFYAHIVMSELPKSNLSESKHRAPVTKVCTVEGKFQLGEIREADFLKVKKRRFDFGSKQKDHDVAEFDLRVIVGSTDLAFEFVSLDGRKYSQEASRINVTWDNILS